MKICLKSEMPKCSELPVEPQGKIALPAKGIVLVDTDILFPVIFSPNKRNPDALTRCSEEKSKYSWEDKPFLLRSNRRYNERRIQLVNSMENGEFQRRGLYPAITNVINGELYYLQKTFGTDYLECWMSKMKGRIYYVSLNSKSCREQCPTLSAAFEHEGDFSLALAAYQLGCDFASDDYTSFGAASMKILNRMYFERWGSQRRLNRHDSDSLQLLLRSLNL